MNNLQSFIKDGIGTITHIEYHGEPVLTTVQLAYVLSSPDEPPVTVMSLLNNFNNNKDHFEEGKHYFKLVGEELAAFKNHLKDFYMVAPKRTSQLILRTKRGVARHCKMSNSKIAWDVFEVLEDTYFKVEEILRENLTVDKFKQADLLCRMSAHERDSYKKTRLVAEATRLILGKEIAPKQISLF